MTLEGAVWPSNCSGRCLNKTIERQVIAIVLRMMHKLPGHRGRGAVAAAAAAGEEHLNFVTQLLLRSIIFSRNNHALLLAHSYLT